MFFSAKGGFVVGIVMGAMIAPMRPNMGKKGKMITWAIRAVAFVVLIILFAATIPAFYNAADPSQVLHTPLKEIAQILTETLLADLSRL